MRGSTLRPDPYRWRRSPGFTRQDGSGATPNGLSGLRVDPPFVPAVRDGHLYARGAADNKGNHMAAVKAVEHLIASGGLPVNVRFVLEGEEEVNGVSLPHFLREHAAQMKTDAVSCSTRRGAGRHSAAQSTTISDADDAGS